MEIFELKVFAARYYSPLDTQSLNLNRLGTSVQGLVCVQVCIPRVVNHGIDEDWDWSLPDFARIVFPHNMPCYCNVVGIVPLPVLDPMNRDLGVRRFPTRYA